MSELDKRLDMEEKQKLENMYLGDKNRDASDKIRGFLFQDLVAISYLLEKETEYVCLEFLEDVDVFCRDGTLKFIQVKYYPKKSPVMKEIMTDLYYQYLRMEEFKLNLIKKPLLVIHGGRKVTTPSLKEMKNYVECDRSEKPDEIENLNDWFKDEIYTLRKKEEQKKRLFQERTCEKSVSCFMKDFEIVEEKNICQYQNEVGEKLVKEFSESEIIDDDMEDRKKILLGLALGYIQKRYVLDSTGLNDMIVAKKKFRNYILRIIEESEEYIPAYIRTVVGEKYISTIEENPDMEAEKVTVLNYIARNTQMWMSELTATREGQYQLINTVSYKNNDAVEGYKKLKNPGKRMMKICECREGIESFLKYLWKIMLDLSMGKENMDLVKNADMFNPKSYIDESVKSYICINFKEDFADSSVILPAARYGNEINDQKNICSRMYLEKPQKWFMAGEPCGKKEYKYSAANISEDSSVIDVETDIYYIECMDCIKADANQWDKIENCRENIFAEVCVKGKGK